MADQEQQLDLGAEEIGSSAIAAGGEPRQGYQSVRPAMGASRTRPQQYVGGGGSGESTENSARHF